MSAADATFAEVLPLGHGRGRGATRAAERGARPALVLPLLGGVVLVAAGVFLTTGKLALAAAPALVLAAVAAVWTMPLRHTVYVYLAVLLAAFAPPVAHADGGVWTVARPLAEVLFGGLHRLTGIGALVLTGGELLAVLLLAVALVRTLRGSRLDAAGRLPIANVVLVACLVSCAAVVLLIVWGAARGGAVRASLFQFRNLLLIGPLTVLLSHAFRDLRDFARAAVLATVGIAVKIALGIHFLVADAWPKALKIEDMTGHHDTVPYVVLLFVWCATWVHAPSLRRLLVVLPPVAWLMTGIVLNDRRVAYVTLAASFGLLYLLMRGPLKRRLTRALILALPFLAVYLLLARTHSEGIFKPAAQLMSVSDRSDASNVWRETENANLIFTLGHHPVVGSGWGHEYAELFVLPSIASIYPQYRLAPHNSVLWLLGVGGMVGFALIWMPLVVGVYLATRSYHHARTPAERTAAAGVLATLLAYVLQAWGDMGTQGMIPALCAAYALALSGKLARQTGAWPAHVSLLATRHGRSAALAAPARADALGAGSPPPRLPP